MRVKFVVQRFNFIAQTPEGEIAFPYEGEVFEEIPDGYPENGLSIQILGPETDYEFVSYTSLSKDENGWYMRIEFENTIGNVFRSQERLMDYVSSLREKGWAIETIS